MENIRKVGTVSRGIRCPIFREGDDLAKMVTESVLEAAECEGFELRISLSISTTFTIINGPMTSLICPEIRCDCALTCTAKRLKIANTICLYAFMAVIIYVCFLYSLSSVHEVWHLLNNHQPDELLHMKRSKLLHFSS